jgi:putative glutamine amidotransferase
VGEGLRATAWAKDGIIECVEDVREGRFIVGVQWHPELMSGHDDVSREIFELFVEKCRSSAEAAAA